MQTACTTRAFDRPRLPSLTSPRLALPTPTPQVNRLAIACARFSRNGRGSWRSAANLVRGARPRPPPPARGRFSGGAPARPAGARQASAAGSSSKRRGSGERATAAAARQRAARPLPPCPRRHRARGGAGGPSQGALDAGAAPWVPSARPSPGRPLARVPHSSSSRAWLRACEPAERWGASGFRSLLPQPGGCSRRPRRAVIVFAFLRSQVHTAAACNEGAGPSCSQGPFLGGGLLPRPDKGQLEQMTPLRVAAAADASTRRLPPPR
jgi:hypothetical protein